MADKPDPLAKLTVRWSKREKALLYIGSKPTGGMLALVFEGMKMIDLYNQRHGLGATIHRPCESDERTIAAELEARGYDLTTLRFTIQKKTTKGVADADDKSVDLGR